MSASPESERGPRPGLRPALRARVPAAVAVLCTIMAGLGVRAFVGEPYAKDAGDALYTVMVWALVLLVAPRVRSVVAAGIALGISWAVEFSQLSPVPAELSRQSELARLALGSTFVATDLLWYVAGAGAVYLAQSLWQERRHPAARPIDRR